MRVGSLFAGIGGFDLGLERAGMSVAWQVEIEPYCLRVLNKHWPDVPKFGDIRELSATDLSPVDLLCGGYPCQPFSLSGGRKGNADDRHLWPEIVRLIRDWRNFGGWQPTWCLFENVAGHVSMGLDEVLSNLGRENYEAWPLIIPACATDAQHRRDRVWIVAHRSVKQLQRDRPRERNKQQRGTAEAGRKNLRQADRETGAEQPGSNGEAMGNTSIGGRNGASAPEPGKNRKSSGAAGRSGCDLPDAGGTGREELDPPALAARAGHSAGGIAPEWGAARWAPEPGVGRVAHGVPHRVDRLRGLGNAVVPQVVEMIGRAIMAANSAA